MASLNKMLLIGNLTKDPEVRYLPSGKAVATLRVAATEKYKTTTGEQKEDTLFVDTVVFGRQAETCGQYLKKGRPVFVEGRLRIRDYDARDGSKRRAVEIVANRVQFLGSAPGGRDGGGGGFEDSPAPAPAADTPEEPLPSFDEEG